MVCHGKRRAACSSSSSEQQGWIQLCTLPQRFARSSRVKYNFARYLSILLGAAGFNTTLHATTVFCLEQQGLIQICTLPQCFAWSSRVKMQFCMLPQCFVRSSRFEYNFAHYHMHIRFMGIRPTLVSVFRSGCWGNEWLGKMNGDILCNKSPSYLQLARTVEIHRTWP